MIRFDTTLGSFTVDLFEKDAPVTTQNFLEYVDSAIYRHHVPIASSRFRDSGRGG
jgi:cyclophilin family peptidyl-prolyl cis-trans isomerase